MRLRRPPIALTVPALLVGLVALLATLQFQWLGKVSEAEREQLFRSLQQRAREFTDDFDREISRVYLSFQVPRAEVAAGDWSALAGAYGRWRSAARFPRLIRAVYLAQAGKGGETLRRFDPAGSSLEPPAAWPAHLEPLRARLRAAPVLPPPIAPGAGRIVTMVLSPILSDLPALLIPLSDHGDQAPGNPAGRGGEVADDQARLYVLADLDADDIRQAVLPDLVARHFPEEGAAGYRVAVLAGDQTVFARGLPPGRSIDPAHADVVMPFFSLRLNVATGFALPRTPGTAGTDQLFFAQTVGRMQVMVEHRTPDGGAAAAPVQTGRVRVPKTGWQLVLQHASGSLDAAVSQARRRNLWLSFGILGILGAGLVLVMVNARRSAQLAAQQMDFVATVSHELRTPLAVIRSAAQNLSAGVAATPDKTRRYGELIEDEGRRLTEMVEQVLEYARVRGDTPLQAVARLDVAALVQEAAESVRPLCESAGVAIEVSGVDGRLPAVNGDETALRRVLHNLLANALKHAAGGRWIGITVRERAVRRRTEVAIDVSDRGEGIDADEAGRIFEPFYRGRKAIDGQVPGNGLGLSLARRVAEAHGGGITVKSVPGEGSTFTLHLPVAGGAADAADVPAADDVAAV
jgi:signal transduction histidine kinase